MKYLWATAAAADLPCCKIQTEDRRSWHGILICRVGVRTDLGLVAWYALYAWLAGWPAGWMAGWTDACMDG